MEGNGIMVLPTDPAQLDTVVRQHLDANTETLAAVAPEHRKYYASDLAALDTLEAETLGKFAVVKQQTLPQYQIEKVQALGDEALKAIEPYEVNRVARLEAEAARLKAQAPQAPRLSEIEEHRQTSLTLYRLEQLQGYPLAIDRDHTRPANLNDPGHFSLLFETLMSDGQTKAVDALLNDALDRHLRFLTPEQRDRGNALLGLAASPELKQKIESYEAMIARYRTKINTMKRRFAEQGWAPPDPIAAAAGIRGNP
jgi:hypothetical protein